MLIEMGDLVIGSFSVQTEVVPSHSPLAIKGEVGFQVFQVSQLLSCAASPQELIGGHPLCKLDALSGPHPSDWVPFHTMAVDSQSTRLISIVVVASSSIAHDFPLL